MQEQNIIRVYNKVLSTFKFTEPTSFSEDFAIKRFKKKYQVPNVAGEEELHQACLKEYLQFDETLPDNRNKCYSSIWYLVRKDLHRSLRKFSLGSYSFPKGSEYTSTKGYNSVESRLCRSEWTCTYGNFELYATTVYNDKILKKAARQRFKRLIAQKGSGFKANWKSFSQMLYKNGSDGYTIFKWLLKSITVFTQGSRFTTVPKNNEKRRPINIEPFGNILTQSKLGAGIRKVLLDQYGQDLNTLQSKHRSLISDLSKATIDLSNASDSVSMVLVDFLFPRWFSDYIKASRSPTVDVGKNEELYVLKKVSSMGNGFTFELMTLILTALCRQLDSKSSVYGDDIIIDRTKARELITYLEEVNFKVNTDKSFISGLFRESCGGNFHYEEGYVKSFDFKYIENIFDCMMTHNKCYELRQYPNFKRMFDVLLRALPRELHGGPVNANAVMHTYDVNKPYDFPAIFITPKNPSNGLSTKLRDKLIGLQLLGSNAQPLTIDTECTTVCSWTWVNDLASPSLRMLDPKRNWAKLLSYQWSNCIAKDQITGKGRWIRLHLVKSNDRLLRL